MGELGADQWADGVEKAGAKVTPGGTPVAAELRHSV